MASNLPNPWSDVLFSWIHLSDIHIGHGDDTHGWDQKLVLEALRADVAKLVAEGRVPRPHAVLVTGDVAFSGATNKPGEYGEARDWLLSIAAAAGLTKDEVFVVPGNHDVQRSADKENNLGRLVRGLRGGEESLDTALAKREDAALLKKRMAKYLTFASAFAPACRADAEASKSPFYWRHSRAAVGGLRVRIAGLNTALLAADNTDLGKLRLGKAQLAHALLDRAPDGATVLLVLTHHPFREGWLADEAEVSTWVRNNAHVHLSGHVHVADAVQVVSGGGRSFIHVTAGAAHGDAEKHVPPSHGYNVAALVRTPEGRVKLAIWPRRWSPGNAGFRVDVDNVPDGEDRSLHDVAGVKVPPPVVVGGPDLVTLLSGLPITETYEGRSALLHGIPTKDGLSRSQTIKLFDLHQIVRQLTGHTLSDGRPCLAVVIDNAVPFAAGSDLADALLATQAALGT